MEKTENRYKRESDNCNYVCPKRFKGSTDDPDSESHSRGSFSGSSSYSPRESVFRETVIRDGSGIRGYAPNSNQHACNTDEKVMPSRVRILEDKVGWIGKEVQLMKDMLQFIARMMPISPSPQFFTSDKGDSSCPSNGPNSSSVSPWGSGNDSTKSSLSDQCESKHQASYRPPPASIPVKEQNGKLQEQNLIKKFKKRQAINADKSSESGVGLSDKSESSESFPLDDVANNSSENDETGLSSLLPEAVSPIDVIHIWEHGTTGIQPVKLWSKEQLAAGGERLEIWQQIMNLFKNECDENLRTFVFKYSDSQGQLMSIPEIIARRQLGRGSSSNSVSADYQRVKEITTAHFIEQRSEDQDIKAKCVKPYSLPHVPEQTAASHILPRKINGQKLSAKDVINIWENGHGTMPPIRSWTASQKLRQQSKISRWKKIVDIFKNDCNGDMKTFEMRYSNHCGILLSIAAIICKYEQRHAAANTTRQPSMSELGLSSCSTYNAQSSDESANGGTFLNVQKSNLANPFLKTLNGTQGQTGERNFHPARETVKIQSSCCQETGSSVQKHAGFQMENNAVSHQPQNPKESLWQEAVDCYNKEELFCRDYMNSQTLKEADYRAPDIRASAVNNRVSWKDISGKNNDNSTYQNTVSKKLLDMNYTKGKKESVTNYDTLGSSASAEYRNSIKEPENKSGHGQDGYASQCPIIREESSQRLLPIVADSSDAKPQRETSNHLTNNIASTLKFQSNDGREIKSGETNMESFNPVIFANMSDKITYDNQQLLPDTDDAAEVIALWENGSETCPPVYLLRTSLGLRHHPKLQLWRQFIDIFKYICNGDMALLQRKFSDKHGRLQSVTEIVDRYFTGEDHEEMAKVGTPEAFKTKYETSSQDLLENGTNQQVSRTLYTLPRKISGRKVSAKDVIHIWNHGLKDMPPVGSWMPQQKIRQQSKISRWKKIVSIFENDCNKNIEMFEKKYSNKANELLPIAAIISKYDLEKNPDGE